MAVRAASPSNHVGSGRLRLAQAFIQPGNIEELMEKVEAPAELDLFSLDIDGNDYHVLKALTRWRPRVITLEYNAQFGPAGDYVMPYTPDHSGWPGNMAFGAGLKPLSDLCAEKGYALVGCSYNGVNAFYVRDDLLADHFSEPFTPDHHWRPPLYPLTGLPQLGHPIPDNGRSLMPDAPR
ncbi:MAG: FkbM family methyltransferase [Alphaproteobacteria bacterium]|nr:FkbM family methyltransferase [Alphaproteobacteria bacterium]